MDCISLNTYLVIINALGFVFYLINMLLYRFTADKQIDVVLTIISLLGGSPGIVICLLLFDRKAVKDNMMSRVFVFCILIIQIIVFLMVKGHHSDNITFDFWQFFARHKMIVVYLVVINCITLVAFAIDKIAAIKHKSRIKIVTLLGLAFFGGSIGGFVAMYLFRHKIRMDYFTVGIPLIMLMQLFVLFYAMNVS